MFLLLAVASPAASADVARACYPPPCRVEAPETAWTTVPAGVSVPPPAVVGRVTNPSTNRSPAPFVAAGLAAVCGSLSVVALIRRRTLAGASTDALPLSPDATVAGDRMCEDRQHERVALG